MLETHRRASAAPAVKPPIEFLRVEMSPTIDGAIFVGVTVTTVDESDDGCFELIDQELFTERAASIADALGIIEAAVHQTWNHQSQGKEH